MNDACVIVGACHGAYCGGETTFRSQFFSCCGFQGSHIGCQAWAILQGQLFVFWVFVSLPPPLLFLFLFLYLVLPATVHFYLTSLERKLPPCHSSTSRSPSVIALSWVVLWEALLPFLKWGTWTQTELCLICVLPCTMKIQVLFFISYIHIVD